MQALAYLYVYSCLFGMFAFINFLVDIFKNWRSCTWQISFLGHPRSGVSSTVVDKCLTSQLRCEFYHIQKNRTLRTKVS